MEELDIWRLAEQLSAEQAAFLLLDRTPTGIHRYVETWTLDEIPDGFLTILALLKEAVIAGKIKGTIRRPAGNLAWLETLSESRQITIDAGGIEAFYQIEPDWAATKIDVASLKLWLLQKHFRSDFFFPDATDAADYLNKDDECFSPKLYAAIEAWKAVKGEPRRLVRQSVKAALSEWLTEHAVAYRLTKPDGTRNNSAIEEAAKVANWDTKGGANRT